MSASTTVVYQPQVSTIVTEPVITTVVSSVVVGVGTASIQFASAENKSGAATFPGQAMARHPSGAGFVAAQATTWGLLGVGLAAETSAAGVTVQVQTFGRLTLADWSAVTGTTQLTALADYYLSATTAGQLTTTPPAVSGTYTQRVGKALALDTLEITLDFIVRN